MSRSGAIPRVLLVLVLGSGAEPARSTCAPSRAASQAAETGSVLRAFADEVVAARQRGDAAGLRGALAEGIAALTRMPAPLSRADEELAYALGTDALREGLYAEARAALARVVAERAASQPDDSRELNRARLNLGTALRLAGLPAEARAVQSLALERLESAHPGEVALLHNGRRTLAQTCTELGDMRAALALRERVAAALAERPRADPERIAAEVELSSALAAAGEVEAARRRLAEVDAIPTDEFPRDHPLRTRVSWARGTIEIDHGDFAHGAALLERAFADVSAADVEFALDVRANLGVARLLAGDAAGARELLEEVLNRRIERLGTDHPQTHRARNNLVEPLRALGDLPRAQALTAIALPGLEAALPEAHPDVRAARVNRALIVRDLGDLPQARALLEREVKLGPGTGRTAVDPRLVLALVVAGQGDSVHAESILGTILRELEGASDPADVAETRACLASVMRERDPDRARELEESALATFEELHPASHPRVLRARNNLAVTLHLLGESERARELLAGVLAARERFLTEDHHDFLISLRNMAWAEARLGNVEAARAAALRLSGALDRALQVWATRLAPRELDERAALADDDLSTLLSLALPWGTAANDADLERRSFEVVETFRCVGDFAPERGPAGDGSRTVRAAAAELARLAQAGASNAEVETARRNLDGLQRELVARAGVDPLELRVSADSVAARLGPDRVLAAWRTYTRESAAEGARVAEAHLVAFVLRPDGTLVRVELGPVDAVERAVETWRDAVLSPRARGLAVEQDATEVRAGEVLRALVLDPLTPHFADRKRVVLLLDGALHMVPFDALPLDADGTPAGTRYAFEQLSSARQVGRDAPRAVGDRLVAVGGVDYDMGLDAAGGTRAAGQWDPSFALLPGADAEVQTVALYHERAFGERADRTVLRGGSATRAAVENVLAGAGFVHLATHGWFTAESIPVAGTRSVLDERTGIAASDARELVRRSSPLLLCGIALAGANLPPDGLGLVRGRISAEELATLDLSACDLAVLSACETNLGVQRAGQGVASLQRALHAAGARRVITSSWRVPDGPTKDLMSDFYRRVWVERKPVRTALWEAKSKLRAARDVRGNPVHTTRDWAAWVLSGGD